MKSSEKQNTKIIERGRMVKVFFKLRVAGKFWDDRTKETLLEFKHGERSIISGFSAQLKGLRVGDKKTFIIKPKDAHGYVDPEDFVEVDKIVLPDGIKLKAGTILSAKGYDGKSSPVVISEIKKETVILDCNHPLAEKELQFKVRIAAIE